MSWDRNDELAPLIRQALQHVAFATYSRSFQLPVPPSQQLIDGFVALADEEASRLGTVHANPRPGPGCSLPAASGVLEPRFHVLKSSTAITLQVPSVIQLQQQLGPHVTRIVPLGTSVRQSSVVRIDLVGAVQKMVRFIEVFGEC